MCSFAKILYFVHTSLIIQWMRSMCNQHETRLFAQNPQGTHPSHAGEVALRQKYSINHVREPIFGAFFSFFASPLSARWYHSFSVSSQKPTSLPLSRTETVPILTNISVKYLLSTGTLGG